MEKILFKSKKFDFLKENKENEVERNFKPNYDKRFGLNKSNSKIKNNLTDCLMRFLFFSRATFFRRCLQRIIVVLIIFAIPQIGCASDRPEPPGEKLPFGVFPLQDVKWVEFNHYSIPHNSSKRFIDTLTYSLHRISENKAELHLFTKKTIERREIGTSEWVLDTAWVENRLEGWITLEGNKVYYQYVGPDGSPVYKSLLYDFNLKLNDTFTVFNFNGEFLCSYFVVGIDSVLVGNEYRKRYNFIHTESVNGRKNYGTSWSLPLFCNRRNWV